MGTGTQSQKKTHKENDMKNMKKIMSLFLALVMLVGVALPSVAMAEETAKQDTHSVTLHKILTAQHNLAARRVTINKGQDSEETKVIIKKRSS